MILYLIYMDFAWWLVPCLPFQGLLHIYFLFTVRLRIFHVCRNENFRNRYLSFYWKKWFYIWYMALAWWLVPCLPYTRFALHSIQKIYIDRLTSPLGAFINESEWVFFFNLFSETYMIACMIDFFTSKNDYVKWVLFEFRTC